MYQIKFANKFAGNTIYGKLSWEKTFANFRAICESFLHEILGHAALTYVWFQAIRESFIREILTFTDPRKFSPSKVYRITIYDAIYNIPAYVLFIADSAVGFSKIVNYSNELDSEKDC